MAKLSAHGREVGRIEYIQFKKAWFSDGSVLKDHGFGWKLAGTVKKEFTPTEAYKRALAYSKDVCERHPAFAAWRKAIIGAACISKRWKLVTAITMMPGDPDGVWSETCDTGAYDSLDLSIEDVVELCKLYQAAELECKEVKE